MRPLASIALAALVAACAPDEGLEVTYAFTPIALAPGEERVGGCVAWALENEEPFYLSELELNAGPGWHHSNWFVIRKGTLGFMGSEDIDVCTPHNPGSIGLGFAGKLVFGQSTQSAHELQRLPPGSGLWIPADAILVGDLHMVNATEQALVTPLELRLLKHHADEVVRDLKALGLTYSPLEIPPGARAQFTGECDLGSVHEEAYGRPVDFGIYYMLPHYHAWGTGARLEVIGGPDDGRVLLDSSGSSAGEAVGVLLDEPISLAGATGLRFGCSYENTTDRTLGWGNADGEMCAVGAFIDADLNWLGGVLGNNEAMGDLDGDGTLDNRGPCTVGIIGSRI